MGDRGTGSEPLVRLRGLAKRYEEGERTRTVFEGLDADIFAGEFLVILGPSGAGKSTLLNLISGIDRPSAGTVTVAGRDLTALNETDLTLFRRERIGFVFQFFNLIPTLTVGENLMLPLDLNDRGGDEAEARAKDLLTRVGLGDRWDSFPDRLSGGEQQRVAVARALAHDPDLVLADEPTGNLDEATGRRVMDLLRDLTAEAGKTVVMVTHNVAFAPGADRLFIVEEGHLRDTTPAAEGYEAPAETPLPVEAVGA